MENGIVLPAQFYYVAGVILLANIGTIVTVAFAAFRAIWWAAKLDSRVKETKDCAVRAHKRIDQLEAQQ
jgi:hypothetical protein